jgi:hypothetical protein
VPRRDELQAHLKASGIGNSIYYPLSLHLQPCFAHLAYTKGSLPVSEAASEQVISLPVYPELSQAQQQAVIDAVLASTQSSPRSIAGAGPRRLAASWGSALGLPLAVERQRRHGCSAPTSSRT